MIGVLISIIGPRRYNFKAVELPDHDTRKQNDLIRQMIDCTYFDIVRVDTDTCMFVDDEGICKQLPGNVYATLFARYPYPIHGNALILGVNGDDITDIPERHAATLQAIRDC
jgi:hypothetical protein